MKELKIDLIHLPSYGTGQTVYSEILVQKLKESNELDLNEITPNKSFLFNFFNCFDHNLAMKFLPFILLNKIRKNAVVHITNQELFFLIPKILNPLILTLHDFSHFTYYKNWSQKNVFLLNKTQKILCDSNSTKKELLFHFPFFKQKAVVIYPGKKDFKKSNQNIKKKYSIPENSRIILFAGSDDSKKNFFTLLKAFSKLKQQNLLLVKIGSKYTFSRENKRTEFHEFIKKNSLQKKVLFLNFIPEQDLIDFYFASELFVQPSFHEGFGFTLLEAMSCSCPVLCSDIAVFHEIAGNSALFFNPNQCKDLEKKIELILFNSKLKKDLIFKGFENINRFNWNKTAEQIIKVYTAVIK